MFFRNRGSSSRTRTALTSLANRQTCPQSSIAFSRGLRQRGHTAPLPRAYTTRALKNTVGRERVKHCTSKTKASPCRSTVSPHASILHRSPYSRQFDRRTLVLQTSSGSTFLTFFLIVPVVGAVLYTVYPTFEEEKQAVETVHIPSSAFRLSAVLLEENMTDQMPPGRPGNLTAEQEQKLKEQWEVLLQIFGVLEPAPRLSVEQSAAEPAGEKKKSRLSFFRRSEKEEAPAAAAPTGPAGIDLNKIDENDKHGLGKDMKTLLTTSKPEDIREAFWSFVKSDHPDALVLRFLRARKWDNQAALLMSLATLQWRWKEMKVDSNIMKEGEGGALEDSQSSTDPTKKKEGKEFLDQLRLGKSYLHGFDKEGRPLCFVRVRLHHGGDQSVPPLERYTVQVIETARLVLRPPVDTATIVFDMSGFTMANMDYTPVKFMIKCFEANYPESLGHVLVHNSPWIFQGIWKVIRGWLDPVVASKVHFTNGVDGLAEFIPRDRIPKEHDGDEDWSYKYVEPQPGENKLMEDTATRDATNAERSEIIKQFEAATIKWIKGDESAKQERTQYTEQLKRNYWDLDPYVRARSIYDRLGMISQDGQVNFYPEKTQGQAAPPLTEKTNANDDLD